MGITAELAEFVATVPSGDIPDEVRHQAVRALVNWVACALGGATDSTVQTAWESIRELAGAPQATVIGRAQRVDAAHAALLNGISSHVLDFDDTHLETLVHPSGPVFSALAALAQIREINGREWMDAAVLGVEAECRIAQGLGKAHYDLGWHVTGTAGVCGAAIAAGRALKLDPRQMACAIGIAATQSSGFREMFGSMCKSLHAGTAARNGLVAAMMAKAGFTSSEMVLEAPRGMIRVMSPQPAFERVLDGIGRRWETMANTYKPYACGLVIHPVIDACRTIRSEQGLAPQSIESVNLEVHPLVLELTGKTRPTNALEAKFSVFHAVAATLLDGASRPSHFTDAFARDPGVVALRDRVTARVRDDLRKDEAHVVVTLKDGSRREAHTTHALGSLERPMTDVDLSGKFRELAAEHLSSPTTELVLEMCWKIAAAPAVSPLFDRLLVPQGAAAAESGH